MMRRRSQWTEDQQSALDNIETIINKKNFLKTEEDLNTVDKQISNIEFVSNLKEKLPIKQYYDFLKELQIEKHNKLSTIIQHGDIGRKFYIVMFGELIVLTPNKTDLHIDSNDHLFGVEINNLLITHFPYWHIQGTLRRGRSFGEIALMYDQCRTATILAMDNCVLLSMSRDGYKKIIESFQKKLYSEKIDFLKNISLFKSWDTSSLSIILYDLPCFEFKRGQRIYKEGDIADSIYLVKEGDIHINITLRDIASKQDIEELMLKNETLQAQWNEETMKLNLLERDKKCRLFSKQQQIAIIGQNEFFGEEEVFKGNLVRQNSATCFSLKTVVYKVKRQKFLDNLPSNYSLVSFLTNEHHRDVQRIELAKKAAQLANNEMTKALSLPKIKLQLPADSVYFRLKRSLGSQSQYSLNTSQIQVSQISVNSPNQSQLYEIKTQVTHNRSPVQKQEISLQQSKEDNRILKSQLILVDSFANYKKKRFNGPVSQENFIKALLRENIELKNRPHIASLKSRRPFQIFEDNRYQRMFKNSMQTQSLTQREASPDRTKTQQQQGNSMIKPMNKLQEIIFKKYFTNK